MTDHTDKLEFSPTMRQLIRELRESLESPTPAHEAEAAAITASLPELGRCVPGSRVAIIIKHRQQDEGESGEARALALVTGSNAALLAYGRAELERPWLNDDDGDDEDDVPF